MKRLEHFTIRFHTPAFLGNAEQNGQWRTPPFKALLRQWWRVAYADSCGFRVREGEMRRIEGRLFGHAWLDDDRDEQGGKVAARRSEVRIRLDRWDEGKLKRQHWQPTRNVSHREVKFPIDSALYLGYGPVTPPRGAQQPQLKANAAIQADESAGFALACPADDAPLIDHALWLMDRYGTLGGRSRNGWGSLSLTPADDASTLAGRVPLRAWRECLDRDWPHAVGADDEGKPLIWQTAPHADWKSLMRELAQLKIGLRTQFAFPDERPPHQNALPRHWLSYPITRHTTAAFPRDARLPNSLRFKARALPGGGLTGVVFHVPCRPPQAFRPDRGAIEAVWRQVHAFLDAPAQALTRISE